MQGSASSYEKEHLQAASRRVSAMWGRRDARSCRENAGDLGGRNVRTRLGQRQCEAESLSTDVVEGRILL